MSVKLVNALITASICLNDHLMREIIEKDFIPKEVSHVSTYVAPHVAVDVFLAGEVPHPWGSISTHVFQTFICITCTICVSACIVLNEHCMH